MLTAAARSGPLRAIAGLAIVALLAALFAPTLGWLLRSWQVRPYYSHGILVLPTTITGAIPAPYDYYMQALIGVESNALSNVFVVEVR